MAKHEFLRSLRTARNLFLHRSNTHGPIPIAREAIWLTPSSVKGFDVADFPELSPETQDSLKTSIERFLRIAKKVSARKSLASEQIEEAKDSFQTSLIILAPYFAVAGENQRIEDALKNVQFPEFVLGFDYELGLDSTGDPAVWIWVYVEDEAADRADFTKESIKIDRDILKTFEKASLTRWPFVHFRAASERQLMQVR